MTSPPLTLRITPADAWFFRESRPIDATGRVDSVFPPPPRTLAGALRTAIGERLRFDWREYANKPGNRNGRRHDRGEEFDLIEVIGDSEALGRLRIRGPYLRRDRTPGEASIGNPGRYVPAPAMLMWQTDRRFDSSTIEIQNLLLPGLVEPTIVRTDMGTVWLSNCDREGEYGLKGFEQCEDAWISEGGLARLVRGETPHPAEMLALPNVVHREPALGIERGAATRSAKSGQLYQLQQLRVDEGVSVELDIEGLDASLLDREGALRVGADGRLAHYRVVERDSDGAHRPVETMRTDVQPRLGFVAFLTHVCFGGRAWPEGSTRIDDKGGLVWKVPIDGQLITVWHWVGSAPVRAGGWDMANRRPRPSEALLPAGTCWICDWDEAFKALHARAHAGAGRVRLCAGTDDALGYGEAAVGVLY